MNIATAVSDFAAFETEDVVSFANARCTRGSETGALFFRMLHNHPCDRQLGRRCSVPRFRAVEFAFVSQIGASTSWWAAPALL